VESLSQPDRREEALRQLLQTTSHPTTDDNELYCLLPCSIRAVKDPMFALRAFAAPDLAIMAPNLVLLVVGPVHEPGLATEVKHLVSQNSHRCRWSKGVSSATLLSAMAHPRVKCVLNCSRSEGEPQAVLEAMTMGCPVAVRDIPGNTAVVTDRINGFVFRTPEELMDILLLLAGHGKGQPSSEPVRGALPPEAHLESMVCAAKEYIRTEHNPQKEADAYLKALGLL
jgi:glycosyltransferase involved in cell wall biosynthesis